MGTFWHKIKDNRTSEYPHEWVFVDTETRSETDRDGVEHLRLRCGVAVYRRLREDGENRTPDTLRFVSREQFYGWLVDHQRANQRLMVVAHNLGFDAQVLDIVGWLIGEDYVLNQVVLDSPPLFFSARRGKCTLTFVDSFNWFSVPLATLGEVVGLAKGSMPHEGASLQAWLDYCERDVNILERTMLDYLHFLRRHDLGSFGLTIASQAFRAYRHRFMALPLYVHANPEATELERAGYYGGRCEAFLLGGLPGRVSVLDINSCYPSVMADNYYPTKLLGMRERPSLHDLEVYLRNHCVVAQVSLVTDTPIYPVRLRGKLIFPVGGFETVLTTPLLAEALKRRHLAGVIRLAFYERGKIFRAYVSYLYNLRLKYQSEGNGTYAYLVKILLNSLYGKFGQRGVKWETVGAASDAKLVQTTEWNIDQNRWITYRQIGRTLQRSTVEGEGAESMPAVSAHICQYGQLQLWRYIEIAGRANVYYCDTDSLIVSQEGAQRLSQWGSPTELGKLKTLCTDAEVEIYGLKNYVVNGERKIKGVRKNAERLSDDTYRQAQFRGLQAALHSGESGDMQIRQVVKSLRGGYDKGVVQADGTVTPLVFPLPPQSPGEAASAESPVAPVTAVVPEPPELWRLL